MCFCAVESKANERRFGRKEDSRIRNTEFDRVHLDCMCRKDIDGNVLKAMQAKQVGLSRNLCDYCSVLYKTDLPRLLTIIVKFCEASNRHGKTGVPEQPPSIGSVGRT